MSPLDMSEERSVSAAPSKAKPLPCSFPPWIHVREKVFANLIDNVKLMAIILSKPSDPRRIQIYYIGIELPC